MYRTRSNMNTPRSPVHSCYKTFSSFSTSTFHRCGGLGSQRLGSRQGLGQSRAKLPFGGASSGRFGAGLLPIGDSSGF